MKRMKRSKYLCMYIASSITIIIIIDMIITIINVRQTTKKYEERARMSTCAPTHTQHQKPNRHQHNGVTNPYAHTWKERKQASLDIPETISVVMDAVRGHICDAWS